MKTRVVIALLLAGLFASPLARAQVPTNSLTLWLDAGAITGLSDGQAVPVWTNKGPLVAANMTQGDSAKQPIYKTGVANGQPAVRFDGINDYIVGLAANNYITASDFTLFTVFNAASLTRNEAGVWNNHKVVGDSAGYFGHLVSSNAPGAGLAYVYNYDGTADIVAAPINAGAWYAISSRHSGGSLFSRLNAGAEGSTTSGNTALLTGLLQVGSGEDGPYLDADFHGDIAEVLIYNTALSAADQSTVQEYLFAKYGVPEPSSAALLALCAVLLWRQRG